MFKKLIPFAALLFVAACAPSGDQMHCSCPCCKEVCHCAEQGDHCMCNKGQDQYPHEKESKDGLRRLQGKQCNSCPKGMQAH